MSKFVAFLAHQPPAIGNARRLCANVWRRGRELLDGVIKGSGRTGSWRTPVIGVESSKQLVLSHAAKSRGTFAKAWGNVVTGYLSRNVRNGVASKIRKGGIFQGFVAGATRSHGRYSGLALKVAQYGFVGVGVAAETHMHAYGGEGIDNICAELRGMFGIKENGLAVCSFEKDCELAIAVKVEDIELGSVIGGSWNSAVFEAKLYSQNIDVERLNNATDDAFQAVASEHAHSECIVDEEAKCSEHLVKNEEITDGEDATSTTEDAFDHIFKTVQKQTQQFEELHHIVYNQARRLRSLLGEVEFAETLPSMGIFLDDHFAAPDKEIVAEAFIFIQDDVTLSVDIHSSAAPEDFDVVTDSTEASLLDWSAYFDELDEAVNLAEEQHLELMNMYQILHQQNVKHRHLLGQQICDKQAAVMEHGLRDFAEKTYQHQHTIKNRCDLSLDADPGGTFNLAVKVCPVMNCSADYANRMLRKELLPAASHCFRVGAQQAAWHLPAHFNVVENYGGYLLPLHNIEAMNLHALSFLQQQFRSSMLQGSAVCVVMKRYEFTLAEFLASHSPDLMESMCLLLQLLEAVVHLNANEVCHRNLNSDNIFVEKTAGGHHLVISDFGRSLIGNGILGMQVPFITDDMIKGGCLLAPEIANAKTFSFLNYTKSDLWTVGAISYEIFGGLNPFYESSSGGGLLTANYADQDLPDLPSHVPWFINNLVKMMLTRNPNDRPHLMCVANALHILLWAPKKWINCLLSGGHMPSAIEINRWLVQLGVTTYVSYHGQHRRCNTADTDQSPISNTLQSMFLARVDAMMMHDALHLLWLNVVQ